MMITINIIQGHFEKNQISLITGKIKVLEVPLLH